MAYPPGSSAYRTAADATPVAAVAGVPKNVYKGLIVAVLWKLIVITMWASLGVYKSAYYRIGPSDTLRLAFTNVLIDTGAKYAALMCYIAVQCFVQVYSGDNVYPWINAVVMNPGVELHHDKWVAYGVTNFYWTLNCFNSVFFFAIGYSQVDFAVAIAVASSLAGMFTSYFVVFDPERPHNNSRSGCYCCIRSGAIDDEENNSEHQQAAEQQQRRLLLPHNSSSIEHAAYHTTMFQLHQTL